jgi:hypothetical protein
MIKFIEYNGQLSKNIKAHRLSVSKSYAFKIRPFCSLVHHGNGTNVVWPLHLEA